MEFSNTLPVPVDMVLPEIQTNIEDIQRTSLCQYLIGFGNFLIYLICFCVLVALPMIELIIGIIYLKECSMNNLIPIYLIVAGLISSIILMFIILGWIFIFPLLDDLKLKTIKSVLKNAGILCQMTILLAIFFLLFDLAWFIMGNIWIFSSQSTVQYTNHIGSPGTYCNRVVYLTGFGSIILKYIFIWLFICRLNCYLYFNVQNTLSEQTQV